MKGAHQNQFRCFLPTGSPMKKGETTPSSRIQLSFQRWCTPSFRPSEIFTKQQGTQPKRRNTLIPEKAQNVQTVQTDQFCPITFNARLSTSCSRESDDERPSLSDHDSPSLSGNRISTCLLNQETGYRLIQLHLLSTNQRARFERFRRDRGLERHCLLPDEQQEKLAEWPIFHRDMSMAG